MPVYWEAEIETMPRTDLEALQCRRLQATLTQCLRSPFYATMLAGRGSPAASVGSLAELQRLPFTTKEDLRRHFPYGLVSVPPHELVRLHCSSGTTGSATVVFHNAHDLSSWANLVARSLYAVGTRDTDVFQNICGYGLFTGGLGFQYGAERLGALTIPAGAGNSRRQIQLMQDFGTTVIHAIPSYLGRLHGVFTELGLDPRRDSRLRLLVIGAEPHSEEMRRRIEAMFGVKAFNSYGLSEMSGPGVAFECECQNGLHLWEDCFIPEIVDPGTLEPVPVGECGELVLTTLDRQAMPILRYRTRDLTRFIPGDCPCGRTHRRIDRITGRSDDMFIIRGCNVFPIQVERVLMRIPEVGQNYLIVLHNEAGVDEMTVELELRPECFSGDFGPLEQLQRQVAAQIRDEVLVTPHVKLVEPGKLPQGEGKAVRLRDERQDR